MRFSNFNILTETEEGKKLVFNSMSGSIFELDERVANIFQQSNVNLLSNEEIQMLKEHGMIIENKNYQLDQFNYTHNLKKYDSEMLSITWLTTWGCNLNCTYCFEGNKKDNKVISNKEDIEKMLNFIERNYRTNRFRVLALTLFGGEPLMNYEGIKYALPLIKSFCEKNSINFIVNMVSNGLLLNNKNMDFLIDHGLGMVQITIDGPKELHDQKRIYSNGKGTYDNIINRLEFLKQEYSQVNVVIRINIDKENFDFTDKLLEELKVRGLNSFTIDFGIIRDESTSCGNISNICFPDEELGSILYELWKKSLKYGFNIKTVPAKRYMYCGLNKENSYTFTPNMEFYKCWEHLGDDIHRFGFITETGEIDIYNERYYEWMNKNPVKISQCKKCKYLGNCGGGCSVNSFNKYGTYNAPGCYQVKGVIEKQLIFAISNNQISK